MRNRSILPLLLAGLVVLALFACGGTGFLGTPLVGQLRAAGNDIVVLTRGRAEPLPNA